MTYQPDSGYLALSYLSLLNDVSRLSGYLAIFPSFFPSFFHSSFKKIEQKILIFKNLTQFGLFLGNAFHYNNHLFQIFYIIIIMSKVLF
jgi:hypothetical protein